MKMIVIPTDHRERRNPQLSFAESAPAWVAEHQPPCVILNEAAFSSGVKDLLFPPSGDAPSMRPSSLSTNPLCHPERSGFLQGSEGPAFPLLNAITPGCHYTAFAISSRIALAASTGFGACVIGRPTTR